MEMPPGLIYSVMVPVDFTQQSVWALTVAARLVRKNGGIIHLLHIVDSRIDYGKENIEKVRVNLFEFARNYQHELGVSIIPNVETGSIFQTIGEMSNRLGVKIIVMGTHGIKGIQKVIGSYAIRVILGSNVPVILINDMPHSEGFNKVIIPFDTNASIDKVIEKVIESGRLFQSYIYLFSHIGAMSSLRKKRTLGNINKAVKQIRSAGLECKSIIMQNDFQDLSDAIIRYSHNINADIIAIPLQTRTYGKEFIISQTVLQLLDEIPLPLWVFNTEKNFNK